LNKLVHFLFFLFSLFFAQAQYLNTPQILENLSTLELSKDKELELTEAIKQYAIDIKDCKELQSLQQVFTGSDIESCYNKSKQVTAKQLSTQLSTQQFYNLFKKEIDYQIQIESKRIFNSYTSKYSKLNDSQKQELQSLINSKVTQQMSTKAHLSYDYALSGYSSEVLSLQGHLAYVKLLASYQLGEPIASQHNSKGNLIIANAKKGAIKDQKVQELLFILIELRIALKQKQVAFSTWNQNHIIYIHDQEYNPGTIDGVYRKKIRELLTKNEYQAIFKSSLQGLIDSRYTKQSKELTELYELTPKEQTIINKQIEHYITKEVIAWTYYKDQQGKAWQEVKNIKSEADEAYHKVLGKLRKAEKQKEEELVEELQITAQTIDDNAKGFLKFKEKYLVYFHDNTKSKDYVYRQFKKRMASLITLNQFQKLFKEQLLNRIDNETDKRVYEAAKIYNIEDPQQKEQLRDLFSKQVFKEITTKEYYLFSCSSDEKDTKPEKQFTLKTGKRTINSEGLERNYVLRISSKYKKDTKSPVVVVLHGFGGDGLGAERNSKLTSLGIRENFISVYPEGRKSLDGRRFWTSGRTFDQDGIRYDDINFIQEVVNFLKGELNIDESRIYLTGFSNGALMCYKFAFLESDFFAAIAPIAGVSPKLNETSRAKASVPLLHIHGLKDTNISPTNPPEPFFTAQESVDFYIKNNETAVTPEIIREDNILSIREWKSGPKNNADVVYIQAKNGGHEWFNRNNSGRFDMIGEIWKFFKSHPKQ